MSDTERMEWRQEILARCKELGFVLAGVCAARETDRERELREWIGAGKHGEMQYLAREMEKLIDVRRVLAEAKSIICVADRYSPKVDAKKDSFGKVARYARGRDYHVEMKRRLEVLCEELRSRHPGEEFKVCVDTSPVLEREHAVRAGIGRVGKHTLVIGGGGVGSWILLGEIVTTLELCEEDEGDGFRKASTHPTKSEGDPCGSCTRCIDACPTGAIEPWSVDARKCISYLTIEHRSAIDTRLAERMGEWVFGCDVCQEVCPHNQRTRRSARAGWHEAYEPRVKGFDLLDVLGWDEGKRREAFVQSAMKRAKLWMMKRNAVIAAGNVLRKHEDAALRARIEEIGNDEREEEVVRAVAREVAGR